MEKTGEGYAHSVPLSAECVTAAQFIEFLNEETFTIYSIVLIFLKS